MIIDAHAHVFDSYWGYGPKGESWPAGDGVIAFANGTAMRLLPEGTRGVAFTAEALLEQMDKAGIDRAVLLQAGLYGFRNRYVYECARRHPSRLTPAYTLDPYAASASDILGFIDDMGGRILKFETSSGAGLAGYHPYFKIDGPEMTRVYEFAAARSGTVVFDIGSPGMASYQLDGLRKTIGLYSEIRFVVCHVLAPDGKSGETWERDMQSLAADNVWFDIAALPWNIREEYPFPSSIRHVERSRSLVGAGRLIWGSDVPLLLTLMEYRQTYDYLNASQGLDTAELEKILATNARDAYGI